MKTRILLGLGLVLLLVGAVDSVSPILTYHPPTEINDTIISENHTQINMSLVEENLDTFRFNLTGPRNVSSVFYDPTLVLAYNFNNNSALGENSTHLVDISEYGNNGTFIGGTDADSGPTTSGRFGGAFMLNGDGDYINGGNDGSLSLPNSFTIECWVNLRGTPRYQAIIYKQGIIPATLNYYIEIMPQVSFIIMDTGPNITTVLGTTSINDSKWHHIMCVRDVAADELSIYVDGKLDGEPITDRTTQSIINDEDVLIGTTGSTRYINGTIDEIRIYSRALTTDEIWLHYQSEFQKYNSTEYRFYTNLTNLTDGEYQHYEGANDTTGNNGTSEVRTITIGRGYVHTFHLPNIVPEDGSLTVEYQPTAGTSSVSVDGTLLGSLDGTSPDTFTIPRNRLQSTTNIEYILPQGINITQSNLTYTRYSGCDIGDYESCQHLQDVGSGIGEGLEISTVLIILIAAGGLLAAISYFGGGDSI